MDVVMKFFELKVKQLEDDVEHTSKLVAHFKELAAIGTVPNVSMTTSYHYLV